MGFITLLLARHPQELAKVRDAVLTRFGTEAAPKDELNSVSMKACKQLIFVAYEALRLYPMVPLNWRYATNDTILPTGSGRTGRVLHLCYAAGDMTSGALMQMNSSLTGGMIISSVGIGFPSEAAPVRRE